MIEDKKTEQKENIISKNISELKLDALKVDLEIAVRKNKEYESQITNLKALKKQDDATIKSIKVSAEYSKNGGVEEMFEDFKKLIETDKEVDYKLLKSRYPQMFNKSSVSVASPTSSDADPIIDNRPGLSQPKPDGEVFDPSKITN